MPVTTLMTLLVCVMALGLATALAIGKWGAITVLPVLMIAGLLARWAMTHVTPDDSHP